jgi:hypothetical protein
MSDGPLPSFSPFPFPSDVENGIFPAMYYDSPIDQMVIGSTFRLADTLTASITSRAPYFKVSKIDICEWLFPPDTGGPDTGAPGELPGGGSGRPRPPRPGGPPTLSDPIASSNGITPLPIGPNQYARFWVTAVVPKSGT